MSHDSPPHPPADDELRKQAERVVARRPDMAADIPAHRLAHELSVYQVELEMQNEELRETNATLNRQTERLFALFDAAPVAYLRLAPNGTIVEANVAAAHLLGRDRAALAGLAAYQFVGLDTRPKLHSLLERVFEERGAVEVVLTILGPAERGVMAHGNWVSGECLLMLTDVTELLAVRRTLREARTVAERNDKAKSQFLAMVSHEIRTPLASVVAYSDLLLKEYPDHPGAERIKLISRSAAAVTALASDMLDISKIESDTLDLNPHEFRPDEIAEYVCRMAETPCAENGIMFEPAVDPSARRALIGDGGRLQQCVVNLVGNAIKFTPRGGRIRLSMAYRGGTLVTIVDDTGPGIPDAMKDAIFQPYRQLESGDRRTHGGVGLGLSITRRLVDLLNGRVIVSDAPLGGARFVLHTPFSPTAEAVPAAGLTPQTRAEKRRPAGEGPLLVVDDDPTIRLMVGTVLRFLKVDHELAESGPVALDLLASRPYCAVLLDMQMPEMDGIEVVRRIRTTDGISTLPVAALTAKVLTHDVEECLRAGCDMHISKPVRVDALKAQLETLLGRSLS